MRLFDPLISITILALSIVFYSCEQDFRTTESGLEYKFIKKGRGPKFKDGYYVVFNIKNLYKDDSVIHSTAEDGFPVMTQYYDSVWQYHAGQIYEGLHKMRIGDSAVFKVNCYNLYRLSWNRELPDGMDRNATVTVYAGASDLITEQQHRYLLTKYLVEKKKREEQMAEQQLFEDIAKIDQYLESYGIIANETESGIRYIVNNEGSGPCPVLSNEVTLQYKSYLLDGTLLESSYEYGTPVRFRLGQQRVIPGWEEIIRLMKEGANYTVYLPSGLAYGPEGKNENIDPNTVLVFELTLIDIEQ